MESIADRKIIETFVKSNLLNGDFNFGNSQNSIYNKVSQGKLNPYAYDVQSNIVNPYKSLPKNFLLYTIGYPVTRDKQGRIIPVNNAVTLNMRIYRLTVNDNLNKANNKIIYNSNVWREIKMYEFIKNEIIYKKMSPNFVSLLTYSTCHDSNFDFDTINHIIDRTVSNPSNDIHNLYTLQTNIIEAGKYLSQYCKSHGINIDSIINDIYMYIMKIASTKNSWTQVDVNKYVGMYLVEYMNTHSDFMLDISENLDVFKDDVLVAITEAPDYSFNRWFSKDYVLKGTSNIMTSNGIHSDFEWKSTLFQLLSAFHVLVYYNIHIPDFNMYDNVFIKKLSNADQNPKYWKYIINNVEYFVPNFGYLVLIDSKFNDKVFDNENYNFKVYSDFLHDAEIKINKVSPSRSRDDLVNQLVKFFDPSNFNNTIAKLNGSIDFNSSTEFKNNIMAINNYVLTHGTSDPNIFINIIHATMPEFLNNRIGSPLTDDETKLIFNVYNKTSTFVPPALSIDRSKPGDYIMNFKPDNYGLSTIAVVVDVDTVNNTISVVDKENDQFVLKLLKNVNFDDYCHVPVYPKQFTTAFNGSRETFSCIDVYSIPKIIV